MASKMISLQYEFIFSKEANLWNRIYEFENDLADFFAANKLVAEVVTPMESSGGRGVMFISKMETVAPTLVNQKGINLTKPQPRNELLFNVRKSSTIVNRMTESLGKKKKRK